RTGLHGDDAFFRQQIFNGFVIRPWMLELVTKLSSRGYVTGILSDQVDWLDALDARDHFYSYFDHIYNSYYMGKGKRDPSQFTDVAADLGLPPAKILFIDDSERNVATAESIGMQAIQYVDRHNLIKALAERLNIELR
ncbi:MAG: HAD-IA family hydrolase, partial [Gammaproteobacteria bacterium]